jgi:hypothetical protein
MQIHRTAGTPVLQHSVSDDVMGPAAERRSQAKSLERAGLNSENALA